VDAIDLIVNVIAGFMGALGVTAVLVGVQLFTEYRNRNKSNRDQHGQPRARV
jgi:hypothetical protein